MSDMRQPFGLPLFFGISKRRSVVDASPDGLIADAKKEDEKRDEKETLASETDQENQADKESQGSGRFIGGEREGSAERDEVTRANARDRLGEEHLPELPESTQTMQRVSRIPEEEKEKTPQPSLNLFSRGPVFNHRDPIVKHESGRSIYSLGAGPEKASSPKQKALDALGKLDGASKSGVLVWDWAGEHWRAPKSTERSSIGRLTPTADGGSIHMSASERVARNTLLTYYPHPPEELEKIGIGKNAEVRIEHNGLGVTNVRQTNHDMQRNLTHGRSSLSELSRVSARPILVR